MNEFEWRRQMRALREPVSPARDLWAQIDAKLDAAQATQDIPAPSASPHRRRWLLAASFAGLILLAGGIGRQLYQTQPSPAASLTAATTDDMRWKPTDPRLAGAAIQLDAAKMELQQAMQQAPGSVALQRLLARTEQQQSQLRHMEHQAG
jgi:ferric-dicitrate binding protein FerR (iron transport regulator)